MISRRHGLLMLGLCIALPNHGLAQDSPALPAKARQTWGTVLGTPRLIGQQLFTYWGFDVYQASLWAGAGRFAPDDWATQGLALELRYARDFQGKDIAQRAIDEIRAQAPLRDDQAQRWLFTLQTLLPNVHQGETLTGLYQPDKGLKLFHQDTLLGELTERDLSLRFLGIWLSDRTSQPRLRQQLLAGAAQ